MNALPGFAWPFSETVVERLGWVLVHSLWQFALAALVTSAIVRALRRSSAPVRYCVLVTALAVSIAAPVATWLLLPGDAQFDPASGATSVRRWVQSSQAPPTEPADPADALTGQLRHGESTDLSTHRQAYAMPLAGQPILETDDQSRSPISDIGAANAVRVESTWSERTRAMLRPWLAWIVVGWSLGVVVCSLRPLLGWHTLRRLQRVGIAPVSDDVLDLLRRVSARLGLRHTVRVLKSTLAQVPVVVGYLRPAILLPVSLLTTIPAAQLEAILAHELAHVQRHDFVVNLLQTLVETLFFYHPAVWWLSHQVRIEREHCCDDLVVALLGDRVEYGRALVAIEQLRGQHGLLALGASDGSLLSRIRRIAGLNAENASRWPMSLLSLVSLGMAVALSIGWGLTTNQGGASVAAMESSPDASRADLEKTFPLPNPDDVRGFDLSKVPVRSYEAAFCSTPDLYIQNPENPDEWIHPPNVFSLPLTEHTWMCYPGGSGHFYIEHRHDGTPESEQIYGPIEGDPFEVLKLEDLLRERLKPDSKSENARYRLRLMFRTGEPGLVRRAWRMIEPELAPKFSSDEQRFYDRFDLFEGVRDALRDRAEAFRNPELQDVVTKARRRVEAAEAEFDELNDAVSDESYQSATYLQPKIAAKIPEALWGQALDGLRLALVPRESQPTGSDWNELPLGTPLPKSVNTQIGGELHYQLLVENVSDHEIKFFAYISSTDVDRTLEIVDQTGKPLIPGFGTRFLLPQHFSYWRLKPGERHLLAMSAVCFTSADVTYTGLGMFVNSAPGQYTLRCSMRFGHYDNNRHRHLPGKTEWIGQLTTGAQKITVADQLAANDDGPRNENAMDPIEGEVVDKVTGKRIEGATVCFRFRKLQRGPDWSDKPIAELVFRNVGRFTFRLPDGVDPQTEFLSVELTAEHPDYQTLGSMGQYLKDVLQDVLKDESNFAGVHISNSASDFIRRVELSPGKVVTGQVLDLNGRPAVGVPVESGRNRQGWQNGCVHKSTTDAQGRYRLVVPADHGRGRIYVIPNHASAVSRAISTDFGEQPVFKLLRGTRLHGTVVDAEGHGAGGIVVRANGGERIPWRFAVTDAQGRYSLPPFQYGKYIVELVDEGWIPELHTTAARLPDVFLPQIVELSKTAPTEQVLDFKPTESVRVTAHYTGSDDQPIPGGRLTLFGSLANLVWSGSFRDLPDEPGMYDLRVPRGLQGHVGPHDYGRFLRIVRQLTDDEALALEAITKFDQDGISFRVRGYRSASVTLRPTFGGQPVAITNYHTPKFADRNAARRIGAREAYAGTSMDLATGGRRLGVHPDIDIVLKLELPGFQPWQETVRIPEGGNKVIEVALEAQKGATPEIDFGTQDEVPARTARLRPTPEQIAEIVRPLLPSIVLVIRTNPETGRPEPNPNWKAGIVVDERGYILTTWTPDFERANQIMVRLVDQSEYLAEVMATDKKLQLAVLRIRPRWPLKAISLSKVQVLQAGDTVIGVPSPAQKAPLIGAVIAVGVNPPTFPPNLVHSDLPLPLGESGSLMVTDKGEPAGIWWGIRAGKTRTSFAVPLQDVLPLLANAVPLAASAPPKGLEFLASYPMLHGLSLDMTEPQFLAIAEEQKLKPRKSSFNGEIQYLIPTGDGHTVLVMFGQDNGKCKGIQRVRGEDAPEPAQEDADSKTDDAAATPKKPVAKELEPFQGTWPMDICDSENKTLHAPQEVVKNWRWAITGNDIVWTRSAGEVWHLTFSVDPAKSPKQIDITYVDGPFKGQTCQGIYEWGGVNQTMLQMSVQDPGANVARPTTIAMTGGGQTSLIFLNSRESNSPEKELAALQGTWRFDDSKTDKETSPSKWRLFFPPFGRRRGVCRECPKLFALRHHLLCGSPKLLLCLRFSLGNLPGWRHDSMAGRFGLSQFCLFVRHDAESLTAIRIQTIFLPEV